MRIKIKALIALLITSFILSGCKYSVDLGGPLIEKIFGYDDSPLVYCDVPLVDNSSIVSSGFSYDQYNSRNFSSIINSSNVGQLTRDYVLVDEKKDIRRGAPALTENVLYYAGVEQAYAIDRETGCAYWSYKPQKKFGEIRSASVLLVDEPTLNKRIVIIGTRHAEVIAIDAVTGHPLWNTFAGNKGWLTINGVNINKSMITGGLQYHDGKVYAPIATHEVADVVMQATCCKTHGALTVIDSKNGAILWDYQTTADAKMIDGNPLRYGPSGAAVWSTPLIDADRNQVLIGTAQNFNKPLTSSAKAVIALDIDTGNVNWTSKGDLPEDFYNATCGVADPPFRHCDNLPSYDFDMVTPLLVKNITTPNDGTLDLIIAGDKGGVVYALNPATGARIWSEKIGEGGLLGGIHWAMATDGTNVYAGISDFQVPKAAILGSTLADLLHIFPSQVPNAKPGLYALKLSDGALVWSKRPQHIYSGDGQEHDSIFSAGVSITNDVLFAGSLDGTIRAYNTVDGSELWSDFTAHGVTDVMNRKGNGGAIDSVGAVIAGNQVFLNSGYSVFNVGGKNEWQGGPGNALFVYKLP